MQKNNKSILKEEKTDEKKDLFVFNYHLFDLLDLLVDRCIFDKLYERKVILAFRFTFV